MKLWEANVVLRQRRIRSVSPGSADSDSAVRHEIFTDVRGTMQALVSLLTHKAACSAIAEGLFRPVVI